MTKSSNNNKQEQTVIFLHIPKAAGSTLSSVVQRQYEPNATFKIDGLHIRESIDEFKKIPEAKKEKIRLLSGHMFFGLHEFLPQPSTYITMLRNPVDRVISHYYHVIRHPNHYLYQEVTSRNMNLRDYVSSGISMELDNGQTRDISGEGIVQKPFPDKGIGFGQCPAEMLQRAKRNLREHFAVVGLSERFDESLILLKRTFGWATPCYVKSNVGENRPHKRDISIDELKVIEKYNELDVQLHKYAGEMFEELITQQSPLPSFERELKEFKLLNKYCGKIYIFSQRAARKVKRVARSLA